MQPSGRFYTVFVGRVYKNPDNSEGFYKSIHSPGLKNAGTFGKITVFIGYIEAGFK
jgi:hypothetical protein